MSEQVLIGRTLDHYRIEQLLGDGSMGSVYRATDVRLKRPVAIKVMHPHMAARAEFQQRFAQDARAAKRLDHANIVRVLDAGYDQGLLFLVMELVTGGSLRSYLQRLHAQQKYMELTEALELTRQIAEALDYAHREGMIHRDIKPDNVLLKLMTTPGEGTSRFRAVLTDFGLAKLAEGGVQSLTGQPMGTLPYMSPEQCLAENVDARTDIYALGVMLYELAAGQLPYQPASITEAIRMHTREPLPPPTSIRPDLPPELVEIINKSLAKNPDDRFQTAGEMARAIQIVQRRIARGQTTMSGTSPEQVDSLKTYLMTEPIVAQAPEHTYQAPTPSQAGYDRLIIIREGEPTRSVPLKKAVTAIGRALDGDVVLDGNGVSRNHARLERGPDGRYRLTDLGSTNGTLLADAKLIAQVPEVWDPGATVRIGEFWLELEQSGVHPTRPKGAGASQSAGGQIGTQPVGGAAAYGVGRQVGLVMPMGDTVEIQPGGRVDVPVEILNQDKIVDHFTVQVRGLPNDWVTMPTKTLQLMPGDQGTVMLAFHPPRVSTSTAGRHSFLLSVTSREHRGEVASLTGWLQIAPFHGFKTDLQPKRVVRKGSVALALTNTGNAPSNYMVSARDREDAVKFALSQPEFGLGPGQIARTLVQMEPKRRLIFGVEKALPYEINVQALEGGQESQVGELVAVPLIPYWMLGLLTFLFTACVLIIALALAAGLIIPPTAEATATIEAATAFINATQQTFRTAEAVVGVTLTAAADNQATATNAAMTAAAEGDDDSDGLSNQREAELTTDPKNPDTDTDTLTDGQEVNVWNTNPIAFDSDKDNLSDGQEVQRGSNPNNPDTDGDGIPDNVDPDPLNPPTATVPATPTVPPPTTLAPPTPTPITPTWTPTATPTATPTSTASVLTQVLVTFNSVQIHYNLDDGTILHRGDFGGDASWVQLAGWDKRVQSDDNGFWLEFLVNDQRQLWPASGTQPFPTPDTTLNTTLRFTLSFAQSDTLIINVRGYDNDYDYEHYRMVSNPIGSVYRTYNSANLWGSAGSPHREASGEMDDCAGGCFTLNYDVWTRPNP